MNEIIENMKTRRSIRKFKSDALPQDVLDRILEAGTYAPTGMAAQSPVKQKERRNITVWYAAIQRRKPFQKPASIPMMLEPSLNRRPSPRQGKRFIPVLYVGQPGQK